MTNSLRVLCFPKQGGNPYLNQLSSRLEAAGLTVDEFSYPRAFARRYDVVHIHWPDTHLWSRSWWRSLGKHVRLGVLCLWLRLRGTRIVWTLHNLRTHEKDHWIGARLFPAWFPRLCTHVIALTPTGLELAGRLYPPLARKPAAIIPHGHYRDIFPQPPSRDECRAALGLARQPFTIVFFGSIRGYKNVPRLIQEFRRWPDPDVQLLVAGDPVVGMRAEDVVAAAGDDPRVHLRLRHIADAEVPGIIGAADLVTAPFTEVLNSGSVLLALSLNRPVLAPRDGALPDLQRVVGPSWLHLYEGEFSVATLAEARRHFTERRRDAEVDLSAFDWPAVIAATIAHYTASTAEPRVPPSRRAPAPVSQPGETEQPVPVRSAAMSP